MNVELRGNVDATLRTQLETAALEYGAANPHVGTADNVKLTVIGADGKPCEVEGAFQRDVMGTIVFVVAGIVGRLVEKLLDAVKGNGPNARRAKRKEKSRRDGALSAIYNGGLPAGAEERLAFFLANELAKKVGKEYHLPGGKVFKTKALVLEHLAQVLPNDDGEVPAPPADSKPAKETVAKAAPKVAKPKAAKKAAKKASKKSAAGK